MKIVVAGGTGLIGSRLVAELSRRGHRATVVARSRGVNTYTAEGLAAALAGADVIVDVSNSSYTDEAGARDFFGTSTMNLLTYGAVAQVGHYVALSVVGTDRLAEDERGYFLAKLEQELLITGSPMPWSIVHSTQFFEFIGKIAEAATSGNTVRLARAMVQPIAADEVAQTLADVATQSPLNGTVEIAGPEVFRLTDIVRAGLDDDPREVVTDPLARYFGNRLDEDTLLPGPDAVIRGPRYAEWRNQRMADHRRPANDRMISTTEPQEINMDAAASIYDNLEPAQRPDIKLLSSVDLAAIEGPRDAMTIHVTLPPGSPGTRPHRHSGPAFGYVIEGELLFELEGEAPRVVTAGEAFWEPGGDVIHYQDANNLSDQETTFAVTMLCVPGEPMLTLVPEEELEERRGRRVVTQP